MRAARTFFQRQGFQVVERGKPFDLECRRAGKTVYVEVKGTQTTGDEVILTPNEVKFARQFPTTMALFVLHSVKVETSGKSARASGGKRKIVWPWRLERRALRAITYWYKVPSD